MAKRALLIILGMVGATFGQAPRVSAQGIQPYPDALTDRLIHQETPVVPPPKNVVFTDPDFGSSMVRATDSTTDFKFPGTFLQSEGSGKANEWSADTKKFYVMGKGGRDFVFGFDPATMAISSLPNAGAGIGLIIPLRPSPSFSFVDPDLIYGTYDPDTLTITSYRFSTGVSTPVIDTRTCGLQPPLGTGPKVVSDDDVSLSLNDNRVSISEGGSEAGKHMFVVVYDKKLGCRWYNTQTGEIGGQWGATGTAITTPYLINHAYLSRSGKYVFILVSGFGWYVWDVATLKLSGCQLNTTPNDECAGYEVVGYDTLVNGPTITGDMQVTRRPLSNITQISQLALPVLFDWGQSQHFTWSNVNVHDTAPVCGSTYSYDGDTDIDQPFAGEIFCVETDGLAPTVWRFAHNRATYINPFFQTQPLGDVSLDGRFFLFTSDWDAQLGIGTDGTPLTDVFIVKLD